MDERGIREDEILDERPRLRRTGLWRNVAGSMLIMACLLLLVILAKKGIDLEARAPMLDYLEDTAGAAAYADPPRVLVAHDRGDPAELVYTRTLADTLDAMRIPWTGVALEDAAARLLSGDMDTLYLCAQDLSPLTRDIPALMDWAEDGGCLVLMMTPSAGDALDILARKLGIIDYTAGYVPYASMRFLRGDILPLWEAGSVYDCDGALQDYTLAVRLEEDCEALIETGDARGFPLLWRKDAGKGRVVVNDNTLLAGKDSRGLVAAVVMAAHDTVVYPIINAGMMFIDDFPAPQPEGADEALMAQYGYDIHGFFRNHWWPDMKKLAWDVGVRYTGVLVETYNDRVTPPFEPESDDKALVRYYASELLQSGGEIGLHGYNHMPLCPDGFQYVDEGYITWRGAGDMALAVKELYRYGQKFLPGTAYRAYVPPSNYLSDMGRGVLLDTVPSLRTISGLYLPEAGYNTLIQEFCEEEDGVVSVPRVTSGFSVDAYGMFVMAQELLLHGVYSHFIHPDDVLDDKRSKGYGWDDMYANYTRSIKAVAAVYPCLRWSTASEGAAAVQRYDRLSINREETPDALKIAVSPFYDEAWLALRTDREIASAQNCEVYPIDEGFYWLRMTHESASVTWEAAP